MSRLFLGLLVFDTLAFGLTPSSVSLGSSPNPSNYGQLVTLTATVTSSATGKVTFYDGTTPIGIATISGTQATMSTVLLPSGARLLKAYYAGDVTFSPSTSAIVPHTVVAGASMGFRQIVNTPLTFGAASVSVGDFNHDGKQDLVISDGAVSVMLGNGDGTFQPLVRYPAVSGTGAPVIGDFNGDGFPDLAAGNPSTGIVSILLGNGDGTFQSPVGYSAGAGSRPTALVVGDFNGDGKLDLAASNSFTGNVSVLLGNGDGSFSAAIRYNINGSGIGILAGDLNGDGKPDLVAFSSSGFINVLIGNGDGSFQAPSNVTNSYIPWAMALGDFNSDGKLDLAATVNSSFSSVVLIFLGNGDGTFQSSAFFPSGAGSQGLTIGDFDGDGKADIAVANNNGGNVGVLLGNGDGTFQASVFNAVTIAAFAITAGEFSGDGKSDLAVSNGSSATAIGILRGGAIPDLAVAMTHGTGFTQSQVGAAYTITAGNVGEVPSSGAVGLVATIPAGFTATSISGNGWTCSVLTCTRSDGLTPGTNYPPVTVTVNVPASTGNAIATATVSGGGDANSSNNTATDTAFVRLSTITTLSSSPNPAVLGQAVTLTATTTAGATGRVTFFDGTKILGAGNIASGQASLITYLLPSGTRLLRAVYGGDSTFGPSTSQNLNQTVNALATNGYLASASYKVDPSPQAIAVGDFNRDGKADLATCGGSSVSILIGNGNGSFKPVVNYPTSVNPFRIVVGDFNGDGYADLAVGGSSGLAILLGNSDGTFQAAATSHQGSGMNNLSGADVNGDGILDLVTLNSGTPAVLVGKGDGTFLAPVSISGQTFGDWMALADMNGDGKVDIILVSTAFAGPVGVLLGNGDGTFQSVLSNPGVPSTYPMAFAVGDFNGDGKTDVAIVYWVGVGMLLGNGNGTLQAPLQSSLSFVPGYVAIAGDFNGDGKLDVGYNGYYNSQFYLAFGNGNGTFQPQGVALPTDGYFSYPTLGDFNGDGKPDLATANGNAGTVNIFLGGLFSGLNISSTHAGNFTTGKAGTYQITVQNPAFAASGGTVTVTDTLPAGLVATSLSGPGWSCTLNNLTCTRSDSLANSASYPLITLVINVALATPATVHNQAAVTYNGITNTSTDPTVIVLSTVTTLAVSPNPSLLGQTVTLTATLSGGGTGTVIFSDGGAALGTVPLVGTQATFSTRLLAAGTRSLQAAYSGDSTHAPSKSSAKLQVVSAGSASGFGAANSRATAAGPIAVAVWDFNNDGKSDLVTANFDGNSVSVLLGNGDGTFNSKVDYSAGTHPLAVVVSDFNNDGKADLAVSNQNSNDISILLGNGNGTFQTAISVLLNAPAALAAGDVNGDGKIDLVVSSTGSGLIAILLGNGDGTFHAGVTISTSYPNGIALGDFNHDGKLDIVSTYYGFQLLLGNGDGTFQFGSSQSGGSYAVGLAVDDFNGDGNSDVVTADNSGVNVFLGKADGSFFSSQRYNLSGTTVSVHTADANGDGKIDVITTNSTNGTISVLQGNGDGTLQSGISYSVGSQPRWIAAGEFNGDGRTDLAVANGQSSSVSILLGVLTPVLSVSSSHNGAFNFGQVGAVYTLTVTNSGPGMLSGTVTLVDTLPASLTATAMSGSGWNCTFATRTCTRSDALAAGMSYPAITLTVNVASNAPASVTNQVSASGGGSPTANASDPTTIAAVPPSVVSVTPASGSGSSQTFSFLFSDPNGYADIPWVQMLFNSSLTGLGGCYTHYDRASNAVLLLNDAATGWIGPATLGTVNTLQNGQCSVNAQTSSASAVGNNLTVNLNLTFYPSFGGTKNVYLQTVNNGGVAAVWAQRGSWTPYSNQPPSADFVTPPGGTGSVQTLTMRFTDQNGFTDIPWVQVLINSTLTGSSACYAHYDRPSNSVSLLNDAATGWLGPVTVGTVNTLQNSQCVINARASSAIGNVTFLEVSLNFTFKTSFLGTKNVYIQTQDTGGLSSGWKERGIWTVNGPAVPVNLSVTPSSGSGASKIFAFVFSDGNGFGDLPWVQMLINSSLSGSNSCYVHYDLASNAVLLLNDAASAWLGPMTLGTANTLQNSQCTINGANSSPAGFGQQLILELSVSFKPVFAGAKNLYMQTQDISGQATGWQLRGTWTAQ